MEKLLGEVSFVSPKGFCFVAGLADGAGIFLHFKEIEGRLIPKSGDVVAYSVRSSATRPGFSEAFDARITKRADVPAKPPISQVDPAKEKSDAR